MPKRAPLFDQPPAPAATSSRPPNPCAGPRTIAKVAAEDLVDASGRPDRKVVCTRDCGHEYFWSGPLTGPLPKSGTRAMSCLGPPPGPFEPPPGERDAPATFDTRKRPVKYYRARPKPLEI